jgi:hypothetical protein
LPNRGERIGKRGGVEAGGRVWPESGGLVKKKDGMDDAVIVDLGYG